MNIVLISNNSEEASFLKQEIARYISGVKIQTALTVQDALNHARMPGTFDVLLMDTSIPLADAATLAATLKREKNPIGIVVLSEKDGKDLLSGQSDPTVDRFVSKQPGFVPILCDILHQTTDRHRADFSKQARRVRLLYAGKTETIQPYLSGMSFLLLESIAIAADGILQLPEFGTLPGDLVIVDQAATGAHTINAIKDMALKASDLPVILLSEPGDEDIAIQAIRAGASDCIAKNENFFQRLLPVIEREVRIRELAREKESLKSKGERLRQIVESIPIGVTLIAPDGTFLAVNRTGLQLMGASRTDQVIGKNILQMVLQEEREAIHKFLSTVSGWTAASIRLNWKGVDGSILGIEFRAIPLLRDTKGAPAALATMHPLRSQIGNSSVEEDIQKRCDDLVKSLHAYEGRFQDLQEENNLKLSQWKESLQQAEARCRASEEQQSALKEAVVSAESRLKQLIDEHNAEKAEWEQASQRLKEQAEQIEAVTQSVVAAQESHFEKQAQWDSQRLELENKLVLAESALSQASESLGAQKIQYEQDLQEFESKLKEVERQRAALETIINEADSRMVQQAEAYNLGKAQLEFTQHELEQTLREMEEQRTLLELALKNMEERMARQAEEHLAEKAQSDNLRSELEQKCRELEQQQELSQQALKQVESQFAHHIEELSQSLRAADEECTHLREALQKTEHQLQQLAEGKSSDISQLENARYDLEQKYREAEEQRTALQSALKDVEERMARQTEEHLAEKVQSDCLHSELAQKFRELEQQQEMSQKAMKQVEDLAAERAQLDAIRKELDRDLRIAEEERTTLRDALQKAEVKLKQFDEDKNVSITQLEAARQDLAQKLQSAEEQRTALLNALQQEKSLREQQTAAYAEERIQRDQVQQELERKHREAQEQCDALSSALQQKETDFAALSQTTAAEHARQEIALRDLEQRLQVAEGQRALLQSALRETEVRIAEFMERYRAEQAQQETALQELNQKYQAAEAEKHSLQNALEEASLRISEYTAQHGAEHSQLETLRQEYEARYQTVEKHRISLQIALADAEARIAQQEEKYSSEITQRSLTQKELERKLQTSETQSASLQLALNTAESSLTHLAEQQRAELSQHEFAQKKGEQKYQAAERQRAILQTELQELSSKLTQLTGNFNSEKAQWEQARTGLEQRYYNAEKEHATALQSAIREAEARLAWISEQNQSKTIQLENLQKELAELQSEFRKLQIESTDFRLRYQRLSKFTSAGIVLANREGLVLECNDAAAQMFGYINAEDALSQSGGRPFHIYAFEGALEEQLQQNGKLENIEWSSVGRDGSLVRIQEHAVILESQSSATPLVERILIDITKTYKLNEEIRRARRVESSGDLAAATVKSLQELCAAVAQSSERLLESSNDNETVRRLAETALSDAHRGIKYARQFLSAAQKTERAPALLNLNEILTSNDAMLHSLLGEDIDLQISLTPRTALISADQNEIVQLIGNLLANAREALPLGGVVSIETSNIEVTSRVSEHPVELHPGIYVRMIFHTDGCALQPERRTASIQMIVERLGGFLVTTNDAKLGNIHKVYLPRVEGASGRTNLLANSVGA